jgi:hypothetical protein
MTLWINFYLLKINMNIVIHPHLITYDKYKCYTWEQLQRKIKHNKSVDNFRKFLKESWYEIIWDRYTLCNPNNINIWWLNIFITK